MALSQQDLDVRLQKIGCCTGAQAKQLAQYYMYGSECNEEQLQKLTLLNAYLDILSCYKVQATTDTDWVYVFDFSTIKSLPVSIPGYIYTELEIFIGGNSMGSVSINSGNTCGILGDLNNQISQNENIISSVLTCGENDIYITTTAKCNMSPAYARAYFTIDFGSELQLYYMIYFPVYVQQKGKCITGDKDNCVTEKQVEVILENIAIMCKDCFKPNGFAYY